jgi:hypothetical protein
MRYFFRRHVPQPVRILIVESGSRHITAALIPRIRTQFGMDAVIDLVTCYDGAPAELSGSLSFNVNEYRSRGGRMRLIRTLRAKHYPVAAILCSDEPVLKMWKWALAATLPSKILVVNENADYFWLDYAHWPAIRQLVKYRAGLADAGIVRALARAVAFPFTFLYLLLYAAAVHFRRVLHRGFR